MAKRRAIRKVAKKATRKSLKKAVKRPLPKGKSSSRSVKEGSLVRTSGATRYTYIVVGVPTDCEEYAEGDEVTLWFTPPPPQSYTWNPGAPCNGIILQLKS